MTLEEIKKLEGFTLFHFSAETIPQINPGKVLELLALAKWALEHGKPVAEEALRMCELGCVEGQMKEGSLSEISADALAAFPSPEVKNG